MNNQLLYSVAEKAISLLMKNNISISCAESCTGGMFSKTLTNFGGVSKIFELGIISYSNRIKSEILKVSSNTLDEFGAVSAETASEMANCVRTLASSDIGISVTGVAGPDSSEGKAPGTVFIALADNCSTITQKLDIKPISRDFVRENAVISMFELILNYLDKKDKQ